MNTNDIIVDAVFTGGRARFNGQARSDEWLDSLMNGAVKKFPIDVSSTPNHALQMGAAKIKILTEGNFFNSSYKEFLQTLTQRDIELYAEFGCVNA